MSLSTRVATLVLPSIVVVLVGGASADAQSISCAEQFKQTLAALSAPAPVGRRPAVGFTLITVRPPATGTTTLLERTTRATPLPPEGDELRDPTRARLALHRGALVSHSVGTLRLLASAVPAGTLPGTVPTPPPGSMPLVGDGAQVFNDRTHPEGGFSGPFNPLRADNISLSVAPDGLVTVTLTNWGNATQTFMAACSAGGVWSGTIAGPQPIHALLTLYPAIEPGR